MNPTGKDEVVAAALTLTGGTFVGVGTYTGDFTEILCRECRPEKFYCVDPYTSYPEFLDTLNQQDLPARGAEAHKRLDGIPGLRFMPLFSVDAAKTFPDGSVDFVYIDANHSYTYVLADLEAWWPKIKSGGLMAGDDAHDRDELPRNTQGDCVIAWDSDADGKMVAGGCYGVRKAVQAFCRERSLEVEWPGWQFLIWK